MKKPSPTIIIYHTEAGYHSQEVCYHFKEKPEVDKPLIIGEYDALGVRAIPKSVRHYMLLDGPTSVYSVVCEIPNTITVTMGCGHTQTVPNDPSWIITDGASNTKCEACWNQIDHDLFESEEYNVYNCYDDYYED